MRWLSCLRKFKFWVNLVGLLDFKIIFVVIIVGVILRLLLGFKLKVIGLEFLEVNFVFNFF